MIPVPFVILFVRPLSVSYTHLDVYKRQRTFCSVMCSPRFEIVSSACSALQASIVSSTSPFTDVYKRQPEYGQRLFLFWLLWFWLPFWFCSWLVFS